MRYRNPTHFSTRWPDSKHVGEPNMLPAFDADGEPTYIDPEDLGGGGGAGGSGGPSGVITVTEDTILDDETHNGKLLVINNTEEITITLPEFATANSFLYIKKISSSSYPLIIAPYSGATIDTLPDPVQVDIQFTSLYIFYDDNDTFYIL